MTYRSPLERRHSRLKRLRTAGLVTLVCVLALWLDRPVYLLTRGDEEGLEGNDWYQMFRAVGFLPTWLLAGGAIALVEWRERLARPTGLLIMGSATATGLLAELLKIVLGRHRPDEHGHLDWNPLLGAVYDPDKYGSSLGLPSSHAAVAFGGAMAVAMLYPGARLVALAAAAGCALTRLLAGAHALSDLLLAGLIAWGVAALFTRHHRPRDGRPWVRFG
ncbi:MAG: phosphatase PAP2 family protein [Leptolyngbya sp. PLA3]|nr:MAG: phosphatase PAP2 family protein [Cyanobacteria bacterium CYA]MCE7967429.1 phosphatase PAP2 family protein [Leptolyngbya sp. PL-A3]